MGDLAGKKGKISDENLEEARRLLAIWDRTKGSRKANGIASQEAFGQRFDIGNQAAVGFFLNGRTALSLKAAIGFSVGLGCQIADFSPRLAKIARESDEARWPFSPDLWEHVRKLDAEDLRRAENQLRSLFDMPTLQKPTTAVATLPAASGQSAATKRHAA